MTNTTVLEQSDSNIKIVHYMRKLDKQTLALRMLRI
jgi:hypothetical protein